MPLTIFSADQRTLNLVKFLTKLLFALGFSFFSYSVYAATFLGEGSSQIFISLLVLVLLLASQYLLEKLVMEINHS